MSQRTANVVVIGGGVNGTSIAMHLARMGGRQGYSGREGAPGRGRDRQVRRDGARTLPATRRW